MRIRRVVASAARGLVAAGWLTMAGAVPVLGASPEPSATPVGGGIGEAVGIGPPALGLVGIVAGVVVVVFLGRLAQRRWPGP
jgi:hypothetical protein